MFEADGGDRICPIGGILELVQMLKPFDLAGDIAVPASFFAPETTLSIEALASIRVRSWPLFRFRGFRSRLWEQSMRCTGSSPETPSLIRPWSLSAQAAMHS